MSGMKLAVLVAAAMAVGGCAGMRSKQELGRLQSQVGLLDERISQLERSSIGSGFSSTSFSEPSPADAVGPITSGTKSTSASAKTGSSLKPSTREIQHALKNAGFYQGNVDGKMGPMTREAIKEFQRVNGLTDDGVVGRRTWGKLKAYADLSASAGELNAAETFK